MNVTARRTHGILNDIVRRYSARAIILKSRPSPFNSYYECWGWSGLCPRIFLGAPEQSSVALVFVIPNNFHPL